MLFKYENAKKRVIDSAVKITDLFSLKDTRFDFVLAEINGKHPSVINKVSDRAYFILKGQVVVRINEKEFFAKPYDLIYIKKNEAHSISGKATYAIITSPPFNPNNERVL